MHGNGSDERDDDHDKSYQPESSHIPESDLPKNVVFRLNKTQPKFDSSTY